MKNTRMWHQYLILLTLLLAAGVLISACEFGGGGAGDGDNTPPTVTGITPAEAAVGVSVTSVITVTFDEDMGAASIDTSSFFITASPPLAATVTYDGPSRTATLTPTVPLTNSTSHTVFLTTAVKDTAGNGLATLFTWSFTTEADPDTTAPRVTGTTPADGATEVSHQLAAVTITFDQAMDPATINPGSIVLVDGVSVPAAVTYDGPSMTATFAPSGNLDFARVYTIVVTTAATDTAGNAFA